MDEISYYGAWQKRTPRPASFDHCVWFRAVLRSNRNIVPAVFEYPAESTYDLFYWQALGSSDGKKFSSVEEAKKACDQFLLKNNCVLIDDEERLQKLRLLS